jgi:hypothetical protein
VRGDELLSILRYLIIQEFQHVYLLNRREEVENFLKSNRVEGKDETINFIETAEEAFVKFKWYPKFGGECWSRICRAYLEEDIESVYTLSHNTGKLIDKILKVNLIKEQRNGI